jgi:hypothetical protein
MITRTFTFENDSKQLIYQLLGQQGAGKRRIGRSYSFGSAECDVLGRNHTIRLALVAHVLLLIKAHENI